MGPSGPTIWLWLRNMAPEQAGPLQAKIRLTATLPTGLIVYRTVEFDWPVGTPVDLFKAVEPLAHWVYDEFEKWTEVERVMA